MDLVFLHGASHGSWCWKPLFTALEATAQIPERLIALDMPGCGEKRGLSAGDSSTREIAAGFVSELRADGVRDAVLVGHSIAGLILPLMAAEDPALFRRLIYLQAAAPMEGETLREMTGTRPQGEEPDRVGVPFDSFTTPERMIAILFGEDMDPGLLRWAASESARDVTPSTLLTESASRIGYEAERFEPAYVVALHDAIAPVEWQRRFAERLGCCAVVEIDAGHEAMISAPQLVCEALRGLLAETAAV